MAPLTYSSVAFNPEAKGLIPKILGKWDQRKSLDSLGVGTSTEASGLDSMMYDSPDIPLACCLAAVTYR